MKHLKLALILALAILLYGSCREKEEPIDEEEYRELWVDALAEFRNAHEQIAGHLEKADMGEPFPAILENVAAEYNALKDKPAIVAIKENGITDILAAMSIHLNQAAQYLEGEDFPAASAAMGLFLNELKGLEYTMKPFRRDPVANDIEQGWEALQAIISYPNNDGVQSLLMEMQANHLDYQAAAQNWVELYVAKPEITALFFHDGVFNPILYEMAADFSASDIFWNEVLARGFPVPGPSPAYHLGMSNGLTALGGLYGLDIGVVPLLSLSCEDRCTEGATQNHGISDMKLIPMGHTPDTYEALDKLAEAIDKRGGQIVDGHKKIMRVTRPIELYVKCKWEVCEKNSCWIFWEETEWVEKESGWIKVDCPADSPYNVPPTNCWPPTSVTVYDADLLQALFDAASAVCGNQK